MSHSAIIGSVSPPRPPRSPDARGDVMPFGSGAARLAADYDPSYEPIIGGHKSHSWEKELRERGLHASANEIAAGGDAFFEGPQGTPAPGSGSPRRNKVTPSPERVLPPGSVPRAGSIQPGAGYQGSPMGASAAGSPVPAAAGSPRGLSHGPAATFAASPPPYTQAVQPMPASPGGFNAADRVNSPVFPAPGLQVQCVPIQCVPMNSMPVYPMQMQRPMQPMPIQPMPMQPMPMQPMPMQPMPMQPMQTMPMYPMPMQHCVPMHTMAQGLTPYRGQVVQPLQPPRPMNMQQMPMQSVPVQYPPQQFVPQFQPPTYPSQAYVQSAAAPQQPFLPVRQTSTPFNTSFQPPFQPAFQPQFPPPSVTSFAPPPTAAAASPTPLSSTSPFAAASTHTASPAPARISTTMASPRTADGFNRMREASQSPGANVTAVGGDDGVYEPIIGGHKTHSWEQELRERGLHATANAVAVEGDRFYEGPQGVPAPGSGSPRRNRVSPSPARDRPASYKM